MEKKMLVGVRIFGTLYILLGLFFIFLSYLLYTIGPVIPAVIKGRMVGNYTPGFDYGKFILVSIWLILGLVYLAGGVLLLKLKSLGRKMLTVALITTIAFSFPPLMIAFITKYVLFVYLFFTTIMILFLTIHFYFFTRPKVKEQFRS